MTDVSLVKINDFVSGVWKSRKYGKCQGDDSCQCMDSGEDERLVLVCETEMIGDDLAQDDWAYEYLSPCDALRQAVGSMLRYWIVLGRFGVCLRYRKFIILGSH
jgi:hypothetical protein